MSQDVDFAVLVVTQLLDEDPTKLIQCVEDAETMEKVGASMGTPRSELMAEYAIFIFKKMNPHLNDLLKVIEANEEAVEDGIVKWLIERGY